MIRKSSDNAEESEKASLASKASADRGRKMVQKMVMAMTEINQRNDKVSEAVHSGNQKISEIVSVIQDIGNKTKVINEIVFQTKLLSFNASVEAARAGEHGKGFAVVAEEIGNLAAMSGRSAKEITALLDQSLGHVKNIVEETKTTVGSLVTESKASVKEGTKIAHECEVILSEIVTSSSHVSELVNGISLASQEQSNGVTEISKAIQQIDRTTDVGVVSAKNCGVAAEQLAEKVKGLRRASADLRLVIEGKTTVTKFRWASEYQIGVQEMDAEHKVLIEKINALAENLELTNDSRRDKAVKRAFSALAEYTRIHFNHEESYMESIKYPDLDAHKATHRKLLSQVVEFSSKIDEGQYDSAELMNFLNDWLMRHILGVDMKYGKYAKAASAQHWKNAV
ncbi:MAG: bacteriohemerythrin [Bdellovibrionaceae bacterium]|nr:bacteriohemerythrin [Pseudobdellovibrionaceae bacterium]